MSPNTMLLDATVKATAILLGAGLLTVTMRRASAAVRYFTWTCALAVVLALPILSTFLPSWSLRVPTPRIVSTSLVASSTSPQPAAGPSILNEAPPLPTRPATPWPAIIWLAGAMVALIRLAIGHVRLALSLRRANELRGAGWIAARDQATARIGLRRPTKLRLSRETDVPLTGGVWSTSIVLPETAQDWEPARRDIVLLHELTHARRRDPLLWLMAQVAVAAYWFHPLAWLAAARFRREQEQSCDDAVVRAGASQSEYAEQLVQLARSVSPAGAYAAALGMAATSSLEQRVRALLAPRSNRNGISRRLCWTVTAALLVAMVPVAAIHGQESKAGDSIAGAVYDASGAAVPGALILLKNNGSHEEATRSNGAGEYTLSGLPAGSYTLEVRAPGFADFQKAIVLPAGKTNLTLALGPVTEAVEVVGKAPRPPETGSPRRIRVGGNVQATRLVNMIKPSYPPGAEAAGVEGTVLLRAVISTGGDLLGLSVINQSVDGELASAAMDAVKQWRYQPTLLNGAPVEVVTTIAVTFRLER